MAYRESSSTRNTATCRPFTRAQTPVPGTISSRRHTATHFSVFALMACTVMRSRPLPADLHICTDQAVGGWRHSRPVASPETGAPASCSYRLLELALVAPGGTDLSALGDEHHVSVRLLAVHEMAE